MDSARKKIASRHTTTKRLLPFLLLGGMVASVLARSTHSNVIVQTTDIGHLDHAPASIDESTGYAFIGASTGAHPYLHILNTRFGTMLRTIALPGWVRAIAIDEKHARVFVASASDIMLLDSHTGTVLRTLLMSAPVDALAIDEQHARVYAGSSGRWTCGRAGCSSRPAVINILRSTTSKLLQSFALQENTVVTLAHDSRANRLIVTGDDISGGASAAVYDVVTGRLIRKIVLQAAELDPKPIIDQATGHTFIIDNGFNQGQGSICIIDTQRGTLIRRVPLGMTVTDIALDERTKRVFATTFGPSYTVTISTSKGSFNTRVPTGNGSLQILDSQTGAILRAIPISPGTRAVGVDSLHGNVLVATAGAVDRKSGQVIGPSSIAIIDERSGTTHRTIKLATVAMRLMVVRQTGKVLITDPGTFDDAGTPHTESQRLSVSWAWLRTWLPFLLPQAPPPYRRPASVSVLDIIGL